MSRPSLFLFIFIFILTFVFVSKTEGQQCDSVFSEFMLYNSDDKEIVTGRDEAKIYYLKKKTINSDINPKIIDSDNDFVSVKDLFEPIEGKYNYYQFIASFKGLSFTGEIKDFHDILILKTDDSNKILDAYQYTLEWAEWPWEYDLYRSCADNQFLTNNMDISLLEFEKYWYDEYGDNYNKDVSPEKGILKLNVF